MEILILTGGRIDLPFSRRFLEGKHYGRIIAADAGLASCDALGIMPTDIIGDFDSLKDRELLRSYKERGVPVRTFLVRKDYTDTHLALQYAAELCPGRITVLGATGTRYDHALANIGLLEWICDLGIPCMMIDSFNEIEMLHGPAEKVYKHREERPFFSLLAWGGSAAGIDLEGFSYPLNNGTLTTGISLGISNELVEETGTVKLKSGHLLVIRSSDS